MKIEQLPGETRVLLQDQTGLRGKALFSVQAVLYLLISLAMFATFIALMVEGDYRVIAFLPPFVGAFFGVVFWRYTSRISRRETLSITGEALIIRTVTRGVATTHTYPFEGIQNLCFMGYGAPVDHPLKPASFDYLGLQTQQQAFGSVMAEGNVAFHFAGKEVRFGTGLSSWDAETLNKLLVETSNGQVSMAGLPEELDESVWNTR